MGQQVGDQSDFVTSFGRILGDMAPVIGAKLNEVQLEFFCEKLAASLCPRFTEALFRCRRLSEAGGQQLLLDTQAIRGILAGLPAKGERPARGYSCHVAQADMQACAPLCVVAYGLAEVQGVAGSSSRRRVFIRVPWHVQPQQALPWQRSTAR